VFGQDANKFSTQKLTILKNTSQWGGAGYSEYGNKPAELKKKTGKNSRLLSGLSASQERLRYMQLVHLI
jgi:hypothetical protein